MRIGPIWIQQDALEKLHVVLSKLVVTWPNAARFPTRAGGLMEMNSAKTVGKKINI